jgi:hypothetical protein
LNRRHVSKRKTRAEGPLKEQRNAIVLAQEKLLLFDAGMILHFRHFVIAGSVEGFPWGKVVCEGWRSHSTVRVEEETDDRGGAISRQHESSMEMSGLCLLLSASTTVSYDHIESL